MAFLNPSSLHQVVNVILVSLLAVTATGRSLPLRKRLAEISTAGVPPVAKAVPKTSGVAASTAAPITAQSPTAATAEAPAEDSPFDPAALDDLFFGSQLSPAEFGLAHPYAAAQLGFAGDLFRGIHLPYILFDHYHIHTDLSGI